VLLRTIAFASVALLFATPGNATTYYVAGNGTGTATSGCAVDNPCPRIASALSGADAGDTIVCVAPPLAYPLYITKSITIDCSGARAPVRDGGATLPGNLNGGIYINIAVSAADTFRTVRLRGMDVDGFFDNTRFYDRGIDIEAATAVYIEDCIISNVKLQGIYDHRTGGQTRLYIKDSFVSGNGGAGIVAAAAATGIVVLDNVTSENNAYGIAAATGNNVAIRNSVFSGNSTAGIEGDAGSQITVYNSKISHNNIGVKSVSSVRVSNNEIEFNNTAFSGTAATMGFNRYSGNGSIGTAPTPISGAPADIGP
jgi:Periplasmic copper-binding protein (NosD)